MLHRLLPLAAIVLLAACAPPPDELYNRGQRLEQEGRYAEAADHYIRALDGQPEMRKARGRLHVVGGILVTGYRADAAAADPPGAADALLALDALRGRTAAVGVVLDQVPPGFDAELAAAQDAAIEFLIAAGADALDAGRFAEALTRFERARRYRPDADQEDALRAFTYDAHLAWADAELAAGRYRAAYDRAEAARPSVGGDRTAEEVAVLQAEALGRGTLYAAVFPVEARRGRDRADMPPDFLGAFDDLLADEHWTRPPLFVATADPAEVRRLLRRRYNADDRLDHPRRTADLAADLRASFGVASTLDRYVRTAEVFDRDSVTVDLRGGGQGTYARLQERVTLDAAVDWSIVTADRAGLVCEGTATAEARGTVAIGEYSGRVRDLLLPARDRNLFDEGRQRDDERAVEAELQERLAERLAGQVFDCLLRQVQ
ncbi:MAG: hypothetical protein R3181_11215 [Rubricoccaceae bacterium]|nr:hypothetical protein [Rubricoccaceae bacterium]